MQLSATDFVIYHRPSKCDLRPYLLEQGVEPSPPSPYEEILRELGVRHEREHLATFPEVLNLDGLSLEDAAGETHRAIQASAGIIYQPVFRAKLSYRGQKHLVVGRPDFLKKDGDGYIIRDVKMFRRINKKDHPEIIHQLHLYGWLYLQATNVYPIRLEVFNGMSEIIEIEADHDHSVLNQLGEIIQLRQSQEEPYSPVGWTKCNGCGFYDRCWPAAVERQDVALIEGVDQGLARALRGRGVTTYPELLEQFDENSLFEFQKPHGQRMQKVGKKAPSILRMAKVMGTGKEEIMQPAEIPEASNYVMFDLEGLPPHLDDLDKIFLWGMQVFGESPSEYIVAQVGFGPDSDREGWQDFLSRARAVLNKYRDIPFVHWHHYEKTHLKKYIDRYGDLNGIAKRVLDNLFDLLPAVKKAIALPLPSYSLKVVEDYLGFKRSQDEYGGEWAMAKYIEATETEDEKKREEVMDQVIAYNQEDLEATWTVLQWVVSR